MAKFDAGSAVDPLDYDFTAYKKGCKGTIPEPSTGQVEEFFSGLRKIVQDLKDKFKDEAGVDITDLKSIEKDIADPETQAKVMGIVNSMSDTLMKDQREAVEILIAGLCSNKPSVAELQTLPFRVFAAFQKWIMGEIRPNPEAVGTKR